MLVELSGIVKRFADVLANDSVSLTVQSGNIHGLVGENGAGKSTLMNILYGMTVPDSGEIRVNGIIRKLKRPQDSLYLGIGMVHQEFLLIPKFTVTQNILLGVKSGVGTKSYQRLDIESASKKIDSLARQYGLGIDPDVKVASLSMGGQQRVEILKLLYRDVELLILDEPTGVLTPQESEGLFGVLKALKADGKSVIVITHKLREVINHTDVVTVMRSGRDVLTGRTVNFTIETLAEAMVGERPNSRIFREDIKKSTKLLEVSNVSYSDSQGVERVKNLSLDVYEGEIVGVAGVDGNGQNELAEIVAGMTNPDTGKVSFNGLSVTGKNIAARRKLGMAYIPSDRRKVGSIRELSIVENVALGRILNYVSRVGYIRRKLIRRDTEKLVSDFEIRTPNINFVAGNLSGGNLQKLILGREMFDRPSVFVVEHPTRGLDIRASDFVRKTLLGLRKNRAAILLMTADLDELLAISDRIVVMFNGEIIGRLDNEGVDINYLGLLMAGISP